MLDLTGVDEAQAAKLLHCSTRTLQRYRRAGAIGFHRSPGGRIRYTLDQLANFRAACRVHPEYVPTSRPLSSYVERKTQPIER